MRVSTTSASLICLVLGLQAWAGPPPEAADAAAAVSSGFVQVAIWEIRREGYPAVRHAWTAGSDTMVRVTWDDGATWYGFRPTFGDSVRGMLAIMVVSRDEVGRGEVAWRDRAGITLVSGEVGRVTLPLADGTSYLDVQLELLSIKDVPASELAPVASEAQAVDGGGIALGGGGGGTQSCCVECEGVRACDCSVCLPACHQSCCRGGCFCQTC